MGTGQKASKHACLHMLEGTATLRGTALLCTAHLIVHAVLELHNEVFKRFGSRLLHLLQTRPALAPFAVFPFIAGSHSIGCCMRLLAAPAYCNSLQLSSTILADEAV